MTGHKIRTESTRFTADAMLGSLARKLRAFGFDTVYLKDSNDEEIMSSARRQRRIIATADRGLASRARALGLQTLLVTGETDGKRLRAMADEGSREGVVFIRGPPLCSICNGLLDSVDKSSLGGSVALKVTARHRLFYTCRACGHVYWKGSHWKKLRRLEGVLTAKKPSQRRLKSLVTQS